MPRMYLHRRSGDTYIEDLEGAEFATVEDAVEMAARFASTNPADLLSNGAATERWRFEIANVRGELLAVVPLRDIGAEGLVDHSQAAHWYRVDAT